LSNKGEGDPNIDPLTLNEEMFKVYIVHLILSKETENAVELVCKKNHVSAPSLRIGGVPKGHKKALGVYSVASNFIAFRDQDQFFNPFVVLHELYHCIRSRSGAHRGTEKNADRFALSFIETYNKFAESVSAKISTEVLDVD
jgi:predicted metallopeptidase